MSQKLLIINESFFTVMHQLNQTNYHPLPIHFHWTYCGKGRDAVESLDVFLGKRNQSIKNLWSYKPQMYETGTRQNFTCKEYKIHLVKYYHYWNVT